MISVKELKQSNTSEKDQCELGQSGSRKAVYCTGIVSLLHSRAPVSQAAG